jgi:NADPH2:quinone reductase
VSVSQAAIAQVMTVSSSARVAPLGADHVLDSRGAGLAGEVLRLTGGTGADLVLEQVGGATLQASLAATKRVTGRVAVYGLAGGEAEIPGRPTTYDLAGGPKALAELEARATVGKLALLP